MNRCYFLLFAFLYSGCSSGIEWIPVSKEPLLHDLNSKVWLVDQVIKNDTNFAPLWNTEKEVMVFYTSGRFLYQSIRNLGDTEGKRGEFALHDDMTLSLYFKDEKWEFNCVVISDDTLLLEPRKSSSFDYSLVLIPFPEL